jgi:hypothetical protein
MDLKEKRKDLKNGKELEDANDVGCRILVTN